MRLVVAVGDAVGERELEETSCDALAEAAATIIALAVDPERVERPSRVTAAKVAPLVLVAPTPRASDSSAQATPPPSAPEVSPLRETADASARVGVFVAGELGLVPGGLGALFFGLSGAIRRGPNAFSVAGAITPTRTVRADTGRGADVSAVALAAAYCRHLGGTPVGPCAGASLVRIAGEGFGEGIAPKTNAAILARGELGGEAVWEGSGPRSWGARASAFAIAPLTRPSFVVVEGEPLFRPAAVGGRLQVDIFARV